MKITYEHARRIGILFLLLVLSLFFAFVLYVIFSIDFIYNDVIFIGQHNEIVFSKIEKKLTDANLQFNRELQQEVPHIESIKSTLDAIRVLLGRIVVHEYAHGEHEKLFMMAKVRVARIEQRYRSALYAYFSSIIPGDPTYEHTQEQKTAVISVFRQGLQELEGIQKQLLIAIQKNRSLAIKKIHRYMIFLAFFFILILGFLLFCGYAFDRTLREPLDTLVDVTKDISSGHFRSIVDLFPGGQLRVLAQAVDLMQNNIQRYLNRSRQQIKRLQHEMTERVKSEEKYSYLATHDELTGLPNRTYFEEMIVREIARSKRHNLKFAVLFFDLDRFKVVNDNFGHYTGDELLKQVALRVKETVREEDIIARFGGDEYAVLVAEIQGKHYVSRVAFKLVQSFSAPFRINDIQLHITPSIGLAVYPETGQTAGDLLKAADVAMYLAKQDGRNRYRFYLKEYDAKYARLNKLQNDIQFAVERNELFLVFQPVVMAKNRELYGVEALARWRHPEYGVISPMEFIPIAEELGSIFGLGEWVFKEACRQAKVWLDEHRDFGIMTINVSGFQLERADFYQFVSEVAQMLGLSPKKIGIEVTESVLAKGEKEVYINLRRLHDAGFILMIDDFGMEYSSLSRLKKFEFDVVKIDKSFIDDIADPEMSLSVLRAILKLCEELGVDIIAEGVELQEQYEYLKSMPNAVDHRVKEKHVPLENIKIQGFYFSKPLLPEDLSGKWLTRKE